MMGPLRSWHDFNDRISQWYFQRSCLCVGEHLQLHGKCLISGEGRMEVGKNVMIKSPKHYPVDIFVEAQARLSIGDGTFINRGVHISCSQNIFIGMNCRIGDNCVIIDNDYHSIDGSAAKIAPIYIANNVWLALRVIVLRGVTIGEGSVIGAGSIVTRSIPPYSFAAGAPARVIRTIDPATAVH